jgi:hypothetical protein
MKSLLVSILFTAGYCLCLTAQTTLAEKTVYSFFSKPKKIQWIEYYKGQIDGINDVAVTLAYDGKSCKGLLTYLNSREQLRLDGILKGNELTLLEVDQNAAVTGQFEGYIEGKNIHLNWSNIDNTIGSDILLTKILKEPFVPSSCGDDLWIRIYKGIISGSKVDLVLQKDSQNGLKGIAYFEKEDKSFKLNGEIFESELHVKIKDGNNKLKGTLEGVFKNETDISANFFSANGERLPTLFLSVESLEIVCLEYADYLTSYDITFPKIPNYNFNRWMDDLAAQWVKDCRQHSFEVRSVSNSANPKMRSAIRAYAWCDVDFYNEYFISGFITFENTQAKGMEGKAFNFDLKKGKEILLTDLFKEGFDYTAFVTKYLNKEIDQHELYNNYEFRKWLSKQDFPHFLIHKDGLAFCTSFDRIYGRQQIKIPYAELKPFFKENNVLEGLMR